MKDEAGTQSFEQNQKMFASFKWGMAWVCPRGIGPTEWSANPRKHTQIRRRFMLLGQTLDGMRVWDIRRGMQALRTVDGISGVPLWAQASNTMAINVVYASLFEPDITRLDLHFPSGSHRDGPIYLNVLRFLDAPQAVAMAAERSQVRIYDDDRKPWNYASDVANNVGWSDKQLGIRLLPVEER